MTNYETFLAITREPSAVTRKFKLLKTFSTILPDEAKTMSADAIADILRTHFNDLGLDRPLTAEDEKLINDLLA